MRIIGGAWRGMRLAAPAGDSVRPTSDRMREGLFNMLSGTKYNGLFADKDLVVADIFAGSGAMGLEALSRGAAQAVFIENHPAALDAIAKNIAHLGANPGGAEKAIIIRHDATGQLHWPCPAAGLLFLDPPWQGQGERDLACAAIKNLIGMGAVAKGAIISVEHDRRTKPIIPPACTHIETRHWGRGASCLMRYHGAGN